jgi:ABC-type nickel/cobalt efflux system permease component RcnA
MDFELLFRPAEELDVWLSGLFADAPLLVALGIAFALGLRHASDPDHLVAVTSLVATEDGDTGAAVRLGAWWGIGHALTLLVIGLPLIAFKSDLPAWLEHGAEIGVGTVIVALAARVCWKWGRGEYQAGAHRHTHDPGLDVRRVHRHLHRGDARAHSHRDARTPRKAFAIGLLHGVAGTGAVVVLLMAAMPTRIEAAAALAVFAPMSIASMAGLTGAWAWVLTRPVVEPVYRAVLIPAMGAFGLIFGAWYAGLA